MIFWASVFHLGCQGEVSSMLLLSLLFDNDTFFAVNTLENSQNALPTHIEPLFVTYEYIHKYKEMKTFKLHIYLGIDFQDITHLI